MLKFGVQGVVLSLLLMAGCAHHSVVVKCDGKLEPINLPPPKAADVKSDPTTTNPKKPSE